MTYVMEITKKEWDDRVCAQEHTEFLQSYAWGEFQRALGRTVIRRSKTQFFFSAVRMKLPLWFSYWYVPRGPYLTCKNISAWISAVNELARSKGGVFLRFEPVYIDGEEKEIFQEVENIAGRGRVRQTKDIQPKVVWIVDLSKNTEQLLSDMHPKTRYNIRLAERKGVSIACAHTKEEVLRACEIFLRLAKKTSNRHEFRLHPERYYRVMAEVLGGDDFFIYTARLEDTDIAAALVIRFGDTATYLHGGSDEMYRDTMAPHLLHWEVMKDMKAQGVRWYDMGGVSESSDPRHPLVGITRFKHGFGGDVRRYAGTYDLIFHTSLYTLYRLMRRVRRG